MQALEDDGRAVVEQRERLARVDQAGQRPAGQRRGAGVRRLRQHRRRPGPAAPTACGSRSRSAGGRRPRGRGTPRARPARRGGGGPATPRPSRRRSGRHRSAGRARAEPRQDASPSVRVGRVAVGAVGVAAVGAVRVAAVGAVGVTAVGAVGVTAARPPPLGRAWWSCRRRSSGSSGVVGHGCLLVVWMGPAIAGTHARSWRTHTAGPGPGAGSRSVQQPAPAGDRGGLGAAGGAELAQDVGDVDRDGLGADEQLLADLAVGPALGDQRQDLGLARR